MSDGAPDFATAAPGQNHDTALARFYVRPVQNNFRSEAEGRPVFDDIEYVEILLPGDRRTEVNRQVKPADRERWPQAYKAFKEQREAPLEGFPLTDWPGLTRSQVEELAHFRIKTVEALASLSDEGLQSAIPMGGFSLRDKAKRFLEQAAGAKPAETLAAEVAKRDDIIAELREQVADLQRENSALKAKGSKDGD